MDASVVLIPDGVDQQAKLHRRNALSIVSLSQGIHSGPIIVLQVLPQQLVTNQIILLYKCASGAAGFLEEKQILVPSCLSSLVTEKKEHKLTPVEKELLNDLVDHFPNREYFFLWAQGQCDISGLSKSLAELVTTQRAIVVAALTLGYPSNVKKEQQTLLISCLQNPLKRKIKTLNDILFHSPFYMHHSTILKIIVSLIKTTKMFGRVTSYEGVFKGGSADGQPPTTVLCMIWFPKKRPNYDFFPFEEEQMQSAVSTLSRMHALGKTPCKKLLDVMFPSWSIWNFLDKGIFLALNTNGSCERCTASLPVEGVKTPQHLLQAFNALFENPIDNAIDSIQVELMDDCCNWITCHPSQLHSQHFTQRFFLAVNSGQQCILQTPLSQKIVDDKQFNFENQLSSLCIEMDQNPDSWKCDSATACIFTTKPLEPKKSGG